jgi:hypothetical protein
MNTMEKDKKNIFLGVPNTTSSEEMGALLDSGAYKAAVDLDAAYSEGSMTEEDLRVKILIHRENLLHYLFSLYLGQLEEKKRKDVPKTLMSNRLHKNRRNLMK